MSSSINGIHQQFVAGAGFISRPGIVLANVQPRITFYGKPQATIQTYTFGLTFDNTWDYDVEAPGYEYGFIRSAQQFSDRRKIEQRGVRIATLAIGSWTRASEKF